MVGPENNNCTALVSREFGREIEITFRNLSLLPRPNGSLDGVLFREYLNR
jgi:hypothetical protein